MKAEYESIPQAPEIDDEDDECLTHCRLALCWILNILVWVMITLTVLCYTKFGSGGLGCAIGLGICYLFYLCFELLSPTSVFLLFKTTGNEMYENMGKIFRTHPEISFHCECYHYENEYYTEIDNDGNEIRKSRKIKVTTHKEDYSLPYYCSRDVSGLFYLNCDKNNVRKKAFIKLTLQREINFADTISNMDYESYKKDFWTKNRFRDVYMDFKEKREIPGMEDRNFLVRIGNQNPCTVNFYLYFLSMILTLCQFYKSYVDSFCITQNYKIRKIISTRNDLSQPDYEEKYAKLIPSLDLITIKHIYEPNDYIYLNQETNVDYPTEEELEKAKQYENKVPNYIISSGDGNIQAGVIMDNPNYSNYDYNAPPPEFASVSGNVGLNANQINANGEAPAEFGKPGFQFEIYCPIEGDYNGGQGYNPPA